MDASTHRKSIQELLDFEVEISKNPEKNASKKYAFFDCVFLSILGGCGKGFGTLLGGGLEPVGLCLVVFWPLFLRLCAQEGLRGAQELSWARFWVDLEGGWEGSGRILELKIYVFLPFSAHGA